MRQDTKQINGFLEALRLLQVEAEHAGIDQHTIAGMMIAYGAGMIATASGIDEARECCRRISNSMRKVNAGDG